jgi:hypothetical protein
LCRADAREEKGGKINPSNALSANLINDSKQPDRYILSCGLIAGLAVATLNFSAAVHDWALQDYFDVLDAPFIWPAQAAHYRSQFQYARYADLNFFDPMFTVLCYWIFIGVSLAFIIHLIHFSGIRKSCFYALLLGPSLGFAAGIWNVSAVLNKSKFHNLFLVADAPLRSLFNIHTGRIGPPLFPRPLFSLFAMVCYWAAIGLLLALLFCVVRVRVKRKAQIRRSEE